MKYREEIYAEWLRLIMKVGFIVEIPPNNTEATLCLQDGQEAGRVTSDGEVFIKVGQRAVMNSVSQMKDSVQEYVTAYYEAAPLVASDLPNGYRKLCDLGNYVFATKQMANASYEFVTWEYSYDRRGVGHGNYFYDYEAAKTDFGVRTGMIDRSKLFSEKELSFLHEQLSNYLRLNNYISFGDEKDVKLLLDKIEAIVPECSREETVALEPNEGYEQG